jgi:ankyrin repeat protein
MKQLIFGALIALAIVVEGTQVDAAKIHNAALTGCLATVEKELSSGVHVDLLDSDILAGDTALMHAALLGHTDIVKLLLNRGADVNLVGRYGNTPLTLAARDGHAEILQLLLDRGANVHHVNKMGDTALSSVKRINRTDLVNLIQTHIENEEFKLRGMKTKSARK